MIIRIIIMISFFTIPSAKTSSLEFGKVQDIVERLQDSFSQSFQFPPHHHRTIRSWSIFRPSSGDEGRVRLRHTTKELLRDARILLSGKLPFTKLLKLPAKEDKQLPVLTESKPTQDSASLNARSFIKVIRRALTKELNWAGTLAAGAVGMVWPGPWGPVVSVLLAPVVSDYVASRKKD